jgi:gluconate 2-dehydrogenase gamma chain
MTDLITRRAAIARVAYLLGGALSASTVAGVLAGCERRTAGEATASVLQPEQKEMVATMAEHVLPRTDTPGARDVGVHEFIDEMLTGYYPPEERDRFLTGLARVDQRSRRAYGAGFLDATPEQQLRIVHALNEQVYQNPEAREGHPAEEPLLRQRDVETGRSRADDLEPVPDSASVGRDWDPADVGQQSFFRTFKELVLVGYYTSEAGGTQELRQNPMGSWHADVPYAQVGQAWY